MRILISGAGIGGTAAALFLQKVGITPTVIDKAESFQKLGYILSLKSFGLRLMKELGLHDELKKRGLPYFAIRLCRPDDRLLKELRGDIVDKIRNGEVFVYRSDLHEVMYNALNRLTEIRFGVHIRAVEQDPYDVRVVFSNGIEESFDVVIIAEGLRSATRRLVWFTDGMEPFDVVYAATTIHHHHAFSRTSMNTYVGLNKALICFPIAEEQLVFQAYLRGRLPQGVSNQDVQQLLQRAFADFAPKVTELLNAMKPEDYVFRDNVAMIVLPSLHKGRVALLGDAGYCPTFMSGMGASLALLGAKALSHSIIQSPLNIDRALANYSAAMEAPIRHYQSSARNNANLVLEQNRWKLALFNWLTHNVPSSVTARQVGRQFMKEEALLSHIEQ